MKLNAIHTSPDKPITLKCPVKQMSDIDHEIQEILQMINGHHTEAYGHLSK